MSFNPYEGSESYRRRNPHLFSRPASQAVGSVPERRTHNKGDCSGWTRLNKTEARWRDVLVSRKYRPVWEQAIRLKLAERLHYTPDFASILCGVLTFWEVKGAFERDDAIVKLKSAAKLFPDFNFIKAQWKNGKWTETFIPK